MQEKKRLSEKELEQVTGGKREDRKDDNAGLAISEKNRRVIIDKKVAEKAAAAAE